MSNGIEISSNTSPEIQIKSMELTSEAERNKLQAGFLGRFFGSNEHLRLYISGFALLILLFIGFVYSCLPDSWRPSSFSINNMWVTISPIITTIVGFIIGSSTTKKIKKSKLLTFRSHFINGFFICPFSQTHHK